jgi:hypothetical protein
MRRKPLLLLLLCTCALIADDADYTIGMSNGRGWKKFPNDMKIAYVAGIYDAAKVMALVCTEAPVPSGTTTGETVKALEGFYADPLNDSVTVVGAMRYLKRKAEGAGEEELNSLKAQMRSK